MDNTQDLSFTPFGNESETLGIGELTLENRVDRVSIFGSFDVTRDKAGLAAAQQLRMLLDAVIEVLEAESLPDAIQPIEVKAVDNPFAS